MDQISNAALEQAVLALLCYSHEHAPLIALKVNDVDLFENKTNIAIAKATIDFIFRYGNAPGSQLQFLLEKDIDRGKEGELIRQELEQLEAMAKEVQANFIIEQLDHFIDSKRLQRSLDLAMDHLDQGDLVRARETLYTQISLPQEGTAGIWLKEPTQALSFLQRREENEFFSSGIEVFDRKGGRPDRKTLSMMIASTGKGKTWWLIECGKSGFQYHHNVLHITLELDEKKTARRYIQSIFALTQEETSLIETAYFPPSESGVPIDFRAFERCSVIEKRREVWQKLLALKAGGYPKLLIKEFPTGQLSVEHLAMYMDSLQKLHNFVPDILIIDYAELMKLDVESLRIDTGRLYKQLRGLAMARNLALITASQGNKESENARLVKSTNAAEDWSKAGTADLIYTYSQTDREHQQGLARIFMAKNRDSSDRYIALISQNYGIGQFCLDSTPMTTTLSNLLKGDEE